LNPGENGSCAPPRFETESKVVDKDRVEDPWKATPQTLDPGGVAKLFPNTRELSWPETEAGLATRSYLRKFFDLPALNARMAFLSSFVTLYGALVLGSGSDSAASKTSSLDGVPSGKMKQQDALSLTPAKW